jgi:WD40 repeat protein
MPTPPPRVFLSYARKDGEAFATALRRRLAAEEPEITLWQDRAELEGGVGWWTQIESALDQVKFLVIVMTPQAMASEMTRREWRYARQKGVIVYPVKGVPDDQLDYSALPNWMRKADFFDIGQWTGSAWVDVKEWEQFTNYLKSDREPVRVPFLAPDLPPRFVARPAEFDAILQQIIEPATKEPVAITTALQGAGGYGKTTLAIALCHDERVSEAFDDGVLWTSLGQTPRVVDELTRWYAALTGQRPTFVDETEAAIQVAQKLERRACLLVIDDVWERRHLEPFLRAGKHNARLITTRRFDLVSDMAHIRVDEMTTDQAVAMLAAPFSGMVVPEGRLPTLARRLGEWPLLLTLAASLLRGDLAHGECAEGALAYVEGLLQKHGVTAFDQADSVQRDEAVRRTVAASMDRLSAEDRRRFYELAIFPEDTAIPLSTLAALWGLDAIDTRRCARRFDDVALVSLNLHREPGVVTLHDVMRAYVRQECPDVRHLHAQLIAGYGDLQRLPDAYAWRLLPYHLVEAGQADQLRALLLTPEWLDSQRRAVGVHAMIRDFTWMSGDRDLDLIHGAVRLSLPALASDASHFCEQLLGRLPPGVSEPLDVFRGSLARIATTPRFHARWANLQGPAGGLVATLSHPPQVRGALVLPRGELVSWSGDGTLRVWDLTTGESRPLTGHQAEVDGALMLPDRRVLSWSRDRTLRVWDLATGAALSLTGHERRVGGALVLPDLRVLSWSADETLRVWDLDTGESGVLTGHSQTVEGALVLPDRRVLSWSADGTLRVWNLATGEGRLLTGHQQGVRGARMLRDGRVLSWSADGTLRVWDLATGKSRKLAAYDDSIIGTLMLPGGEVLSWSGGGVLLDHGATLRVWDLATGKSRPLTGHKGHIVGALVLPDGRVLSWSTDRTLRVWDVATGESRGVLSGHERSVEGALVLREGRVVSWSDDGTLRVWDLVTGKGRPLTGHEHFVRGALVLSEGRVLSWSADGTLRVWDVMTDDGRRLTGHEGLVKGALMLPGQRILSWSADATLRVWDEAMGEIRSLTGHEEAVEGALVLPDGRVLSWSADRTLRVWHLATGESRTLTGHERAAVTGALVLPDGRVLSWGDGSTLRVWDLTTGQEDSFLTVGGEVLIGRGEVIGALVLPDPDGRVVSWGGDHWAGTLQVSDVVTGKTYVLEGHARRINGALPMPYERVLSWSDDRTLRVWDVGTGESRALTGHELSVNGACVLPDGRVVSWSWDPILRVWDATTGESRMLTGHESWIEGARVLRDGRVLSWSRDGMLQVWDVATGVGRALAGHAEEVTGTLELPDGRILSWGKDRTLRCQGLDGPAFAYYFDAAPTVVIHTGSRRFFVGDALGRVHVLEELLD